MRYLRTVLLIVVCLALVANDARAAFYGWNLSSETPTTDEILTLTFSGGIPDHCWETVEMTASKVGNNLTVHINEEKLGLPACLHLWGGTWQEKQDFGRLPAGTYHLFVTYTMTNVGFNPGIVTQTVLFDDDITVSLGSSTPYMYWTEQAGFEEDGVFPEVGLPGNSFSYAVDYQEFHGEEPAAGYPLLHIYKDGIEVGEGPFEMTAESQADVITGRSYVATLPGDGFSYEPLHEYSYSFSVEDIGGDIGVGDPIDPTLGPAIMDPICCSRYTEGFTGNIDCDTDGIRNLADITRLIDYVYISKAELCCEKSGNTDGDAEASINLADITALIDHIYIEKAETSLCE